MKACPHCGRVIGEYPYGNVQPPTVARLFDAVLQETGIGVDAILGSSRARPVSEARKIVYAVLRERFALSYPEIGKWTGRDHTTVLAGVRNVDRDVMTAVWFHYESLVKKDQGRQRRRVRR